MDKVPLNPSNVHTKFCLNNQDSFSGITRIDLEESAKNVISDRETGRYFPVVGGQIRRAQTHGHGAAITLGSKMCTEIFDPDLDPSILQRSQ